MLSKGYKPAKSINYLYSTKYKGRSSSKITLILEAALLPITRKCASVRHCGREHASTAWVLRNRLEKGLVCRTTGTDV